MVIAGTDDAFIAAEGLDKGSMRLIDADEATRLYGRMGQGRETSGGSAANTMAGTVSGWQEALKISASWGGKLPLARLLEVRRFVPDASFLRSRAERKGRAAAAARPASKAGPLFPAS